MPLLDRFAPPPGNWDASGLRVLRSLLIAHAAVRTYFWLVPDAGDYPSANVVIAIVLTLRGGLVAAAIVSLWRRLGRAAAAAAALLVFVQVALSFPNVADHVYLELVCLVLVACFDVENDNDGRLLRSALCWMAVIVLFYSGFQKVLHGYYFFAELPLTLVAQKDPFGDLFAWFLPRGETRRLQQLNLMMQDAGPLRATSAVVLVLANAIWAAAIALAILVVSTPLRRFGAVGAIGLVLLVHGFARQPMHALLMTQLLLLCIPGQWNKRLAPLLIVAYVGVFLAATVFAPDYVPRGRQL
jgi:hypothetical protein